jgi:acetyl esterase/lipase
MMGGVTRGVRRSGAAGAALAASVVLSLAACGAPGGSSSSSAPSPALSTPAATSGSPSQSAQPSPGASAFDPAAVSTLYATTARTGSKPPLVVLVPGGGWNTHDNSGLVPLAERLADAGFVVVNTSYRAGKEGQIFPVPAQDVQCAIAYAARAAKDAGLGGGPVVVVGHSAGGHLAALAAVSGTALKADCADPSPRIAGLVGLGGVYDTAGFEPYLKAFFGASRQDDPALWATGDPIAYVADGKAPRGLRVLLIAGADDYDVPVEQAKAFDAALRKAGVPVTLTIAPGADHGDLYTPAVAAAPITAFVRRLARS